MAGLTLFHRVIDTLATALGDVARAPGIARPEPARETRDSHLPRPADLLSVSTDFDRFRR
ncbi:hypothetical protein PQ455_13845 [Sphingomonas naphthae]|uniref:Uncharacterized protein n=1 Tax=Sphingomonas naphthae TaxID=1813468 RepID=A0ABY7THR1_9SPHN|nr:hypothetical protein [Sphingomonas naphthae]WCT72710.1 hypothetical protein PQ455_13845 [Sphingomonas naphthae]